LSRLEESGRMIRGGKDMSTISQILLLDRAATTVGSGRDAEMMNQSYCQPLEIDGAFR
jgi:hypothetical protein